MLDFHLHKLGPKRLEELVGHLCRKLLGPATRVYGSGPDGGVDGRFRGTAQEFPSKAEPWRGRFIIQAKWTESSEASCSEPAFERLVKREIPKVKERREEEGCDCYLLFTNRKLMAPKDEELAELIREGTGVANVAVLGKETIESYLEEAHWFAKGLGMQVEPSFPAEPSPSNPAPSGSPLYGVPDTRSTKFVGRETELDQVRKLLGQAGSVRIAASVEGLPGIGKTELALQLVHRLAGGDGYPGGIFWFNAEDPDLVPAWGGGIADALGLPPGPIEERGVQVLRSLSQQAVPALLVLDNVESWAEGRRPGPLPSGNHLRYLVTTRQRNLGGTGFRHVEVGFLEDGFARELLDSVAKRKLAGADGYEELLAYLGGHALALELSGAFLREYPGETPRSYLVELRGGEDVESEVSELVQYNRTVRQAFSALWERAGDEVRDAWRLAACFEPEPVTVELSDAVGLKRKERGRLRRLHLIQHTDDGGWWMHRLTREYGRGVEGAEGALRRFVEGCARFAGRIEISDGFRHYLPNRPHLDAAVQKAPEVLGSEDERVSRFLDRVATALQSAGDLRRARRLFEQALASELENLGEDHPEVATSRSNLAVVLKALGDLRGAKDLLEQALASDLENLGEDHPEVATSRSNLAGVLQALGDLPGAKELLEQALASDLESLGEDHPEVAIDRSNLALVLQALGDLPGAKELLEQALASDLENLGEDHPNVARCRILLSSVLQDLGETERAGDLARAAVQTASSFPEGSYDRVNIERMARGILGTDS